jgi:hypothetical protein
MGSPFISSFICSQSVWFLSGFSQKHKIASATTGTLLVKGNEEMGRLFLL